MRPRHYCRGRRLLLSTTQRSIKCFNEAAALLPREARALLGYPAAGRWASMRPRHYCRGRPPRSFGRFQAPNFAAASMRPRHYCRGRHIIGKTNTGNLVLGFNEAAALLPREANSGRSGGVHK